MDPLELVSFPISTIILVWRFGNELRRVVVPTDKYDVGDDLGTWVCSDQYAASPGLWEKSDIPESALVQGF